MDECVDKNLGSCVKRLIKCRPDNNVRCQKHYNIYHYGLCSERHFLPTPATGKDGLCWTHRAGMATKKILSIGDVNEYGVEIIDGPFKNNNHWKWQVLCPICKESMLIATTTFKAKKSCYSCRGVVLRKSSDEITWRQLYGVLLGRKQAKQLGCDLTLEQFIDISSKKCFYCGADPTPSKGYRPWANYVMTNGLDRIDSSRGYVYDNVVPCCKWCNISKLDRTQQEFLEWANKLASYQGMRHFTHIHTLAT